jgi:tRNA-specific 2-thiouridylase
MKFDKLFERARILGCDCVVTGHYARIEKEDGVYFLKKALDETKDQSYVLYPIDQETLSMILFPLGGLVKETDVRRIAEEKGFVNAHKHDSEDICFVPDGNYAGLIERTTGRKSVQGDIVNQDGEVLGRHKGAEHYTIGQRRGLGLAVPESVYVLSKDMDRNIVEVGPNTALFHKELEVEDLFWMRTVPAAGEQFRCSCKIRYRQKEQPALATMTEDGRVSVVFDEPQRAITRGQAAVFYDGDLVIGGGTIC